MLDSNDSITPCNHQSRGVFKTALERVEDSLSGIWKHFEIGFPSNFQGSLCFSHRIRWLRSGASLVNLSVAPPVKIHDHTVNATSLKLLR